MSVFQKTGKAKLTTIALLSSTAISGGAPVTAQDTADVSEDMVFEEIMVTATRRATTVQDVPYNISAVSGAAIERAKMIDTAELLRSMAGVTVADTGIRNAGVVSTIKIRGLNVDTSGRSDYAVMAAPTVASYINETPLFTNVLLRDLDHVEVLRGPQGTLYGSGALGGAVRYMTNKPELGEFSGTVSGTASTTKGSGGVSWSGDVILNVPLGDTLAARFVATRLDYKGLTDYVNLYDLDENGVPIAPNGILDPEGSFHTEKDADWAEVSFFRGSLLWQPSETFDVNFSYTRQSSETGGRRASAFGYSDGWGNPYGEYESGSVQTEPSEADVELGALEVNVDLGFATLTSSSSLYDTTGESVSENTGYYANVGWLTSFYYNHARPLATAARGYGDEAFIQEVRFVSNNDGPFNWVAGVYYQNQDKKATQQSYMRGSKAYVDALLGFDVPWVSGDQDWDYDAVLTSKEKAIFGEVTYDISDRLHLNAGIRHFKSDVTSVVHMELPWWVPADIVDVDKNVEENGTLFKFNLSYDMSDNDKVYGTFSQGYRRGGANAVPLAGWYGEDPAWESFASDTVDNFEIGFKGAKENFNYTVSAFLVKWQDPQINTSSTNGGFFVVANGGKATTKGVEVELSGAVTDNLNYVFGYGFVDSSLTSDFMAPDGRFIAGDGAVLPGVPKHSVNLALNYSRQISNSVMFYGHLDGYYQSSSQNSINADSAFYGATIPDFSIFNASGTFSWENIDLTVFIKNLFDARGVTGIYKSEWGGTRPDANYYGSGAKQDIALPRTVGIAATYNF